MRATGLFAAVIAICFLLASSGTAQGELLSYWNFNNAVENSESGHPGEFNSTGTEEVYNATFKTISPASDGVYAASSSVDFSDLNGSMGGLDTDASWGTYAGTTENAVGATPAGQAFALQGIGNNGHYITFKLSTAGYEDLNLTYAARRNSTGFTDEDWSYSTDGSSFTYVATINDIDPNWNTDPTRTVNFSSISATDNQGTLYVRVMFDGATSGSNSNTRIDNAQFNATAIPEPTSVALSLLAMIGLVTWQRIRG